MWIRREHRRGQQWCGVRTGTLRAHVSGCGRRWRERRAEVGSRQSGKRGASAVQHGRLIVREGPAGGCGGSFSRSGREVGLACEPQRRRHSRANILDGHVTLRARAAAVPDRRRAGHGGGAERGGWRCTCLYMCVCVYMSYSRVPCHSTPARHTRAVPAHSAAPVPVPPPGWLPSATRGAPAGPASHHPRGRHVPLVT